VTLSKSSQILGWVLIIVCVLSAPAAMLVHGRSTSEKSSESSRSSWSGFLGKRDHILAVKLYGPISDENETTSWFSHGDSATSVKQKLRKAIKNDHVKAILLRINSPGGTVGMSQEIYDAVMALRDKKVPVTVSMGDVAASGGYYIASAADKIYADPGTLTGSIGVIMHLLNWQETERKIGLVPDVIKSGQFKDIGSPDRAMTKAEKDLLQGIIMDSYDQFVSAVAKGRKLDKQEVIKLADGRVYSGRQAAKLKLVDELGSYDDALAFVQKQCREKLSLKDDLPVEEGSSLESLEQLLSGNASLSLPSPFGATTNMLQGMIPLSANPRYNKVPLWIMQ
jgi:protease-4